VTQFDPEQIDVWTLMALVASPILVSACEAFAYLV
jgi:hypothetical protein